MNSGLMRTANIRRHRPRHPVNRHLHTNTISRSRIHIRRNRVPTRSNHSNHLRTRNQGGLRQRSTRRSKGRRRAHRQPTIPSANIAPFRCLVRRCTRSNPCGIAQRLHDLSPRALASSRG